jgi:hypothetical protein
MTEVGLILMLFKYVSPALKDGVAWMAAVVLLGAAMVGGMAVVIVGTRRNWR